MELCYELSGITQMIPKFWEIAKHFDVIALSGGLGAGKTTLTSALCQYLGVKDTVSSPTFSIINEYKYLGENGMDNTIYHADLYRLESIDNAIDAGIEYILQQKDALCIIEWPEIAKDLLPAQTLWVTIKPTNNSKRILSIE